ncbi:hypothetical protein JTE90_002312 [Oedothorax gibbosus]|uniref:Uncharacterized protein n=1 Tax=Oedothorax gibbosus TaxID=931172 RepID=A0AAV6UK00_9ARAC|nr:hypothetical protein JTE90_002312 [Oedothorax gibbosus]
MSCPLYYAGLDKKPQSCACWSSSKSLDDRVSCLQATNKWGVASTLPSSVPITVVEGPNCYEADNFDLY